MSDRRLEDEAAGEVGDGGSVLTSKVKCSAIGKKMPVWKIDAP